MIRLFAALALPDDIVGPLGARQIGLNGARWRPREALHVTLRFFGEVREDVARDLDLELAAIAGPPLTLRLEGAGFFGEGADIHAVWAGVAMDENLKTLAKACERAARRAGLKAEARAYRPHVTLAYLNRPAPAEVIAWTQANTLLKSPEFRVDAFGLYSSWRSSQGSQYRMETAYALG
jgi:RNA 2',3'-cyclic 3'-phosphodiesterase